MYASELIDKLRELIRQHGDQECVDAHDDPIGDPEYSADNNPVFVIADTA